jgi:hypothetical protein
MLQPRTFLFLLLICSVNVNAQNELYTGGSGRGDCCVKTNSVFLFGQPVLIFSGGGGKGDHTGQSILSYLNGESVTIAYRGGTGRGDISTRSTSTYLNGESINPLYSGGNGRGDNNVLLQQSYLTGESVMLPFAGGPGRGDIVSKSAELFLNNETATSFFRGGNGRGDFSASVSAMYLSGENINMAYEGGPGRGDISSKRGLDLLQNGPVTLNMKLFIEGFYLGGGLMQPVIDPLNLPGICDAVSLELHDAFFPYNLAFSTSELMMTNGNATFHIPETFKNNSYYLTGKHRNSLETWSADPVLLSSTLLNYNFTDFITRAYGDNMTSLGDGNFAFWSGDASDANAGRGIQDGVIESQDYSDIENGVQAIMTGYVPEDLTGDGVVESSDYSLIENNIATLKFLLRP